MNERIRRSRDSHEDYSYDRDLIEDNRVRSRKPPQYSDIGSQLSLEQLLEEDELVMSPAFRKKPNNNNNNNNPNRKNRFSTRKLKKHELYSNTGYKGVETDNQETVEEDKSRQLQSSLSNKSNNSQVIKASFSSSMEATSTVAEVSPQPQAKTQPIEPLNVANLSTAEKLREAIKRAAMKLPKAVGEQLLAMVTGASLATMVGVLGAYAASHAVGIGFIADAVMVVGAGALIGWQAVTVAKDIWSFAQFINATTEEDLDKAGQHLADAIATVGVDIIIGILTKRAAGKAKNYGDDLNRVDKVSAHSDDVINPNHVNDVDNASKIDESYSIQSKGNPLGRPTLYSIEDIGREILHDPIATIAHQRITEQGTKIVITAEPPPQRSVDGFFESTTNTIYIFEETNVNVKQAVQTLVHESTHVQYRYGKRVANTKYEEFRAFCRDFVYARKRRPNFEERKVIWKHINTEPMYSGLTEGKNPFKQ